MLSDLRTRTKISLGFALPIVLLLAVAGLSYTNTLRLQRHTEWVTRTHRAIAAATTLASAMVDQESGERGFLLTGDENGLEAYARGKDAFRQALADAEEIVGDDDEQMARLSKVSELADTWDTQYARALIGKRRDVEAGRATLADVLKLEKEKNGPAIMEQIRAAVAEFTGAAQASLAVRSEAAAAQGAMARWSVLGLAAGALLLSALAVLWLARNVGAGVRRLTDEAGALTRAVAEGRLQHRAATDEVSSELRPVLDGMNATMDALARPIATASDFLVRLSNGEIPPPIEEHAAGDFERINDALNRCTASVAALVEDATALAQAGAAGRLAVRADPARHRGEFRRVVEGVNATLDAVVRPIQSAAAALDRLSRGELPERIEEDWAGDFSGVRDSLNALLDAFRGLLEELRRLTRAHAEGDTEAELDPSRFAGAYRELAAGMNDSFQMYVSIVRELLGILQKYASGDFEPVLRELPGKQARATRALEALRTNLRNVSGEVQQLVEAARAGDLHTRADVARFHGDWARMVEGLNATLDELIRPVGEAAEVLDGLARRDLRARMTGEYRGEHARIKEALNGTAGALHDALAQVAAAVEQVSSAAAQISSSAHAVASGASEQASTIEETSSSIEAVARRTKQSAEAAAQARAIAVSARAAATQGAAAVEQLQAAVERIRKSAAGSSAIIRDVSDIAFQTNLLALNAAVEAARAGEAGRGFAVVAEEVRSLALRAKEAAQKTEGLIGESVKQAAEGEAAAGKVSGTLRDILGGVNQVTQVVDGIAAGAAEQAGGIDQVNHSISEMDKVTQQNAASAEESSSAAAELNGQAEELASMVATFQIERGTRDVRAGEARPARAARVRAQAALPPAGLDPDLDLDLDVDMGVVAQAPVSPASRSRAAR